MPPGSSHLSVVARDGKELRARYVGLDGQTGISVLRISGLAFAIPSIETEKAVVSGERLRLFAPEGAPPTTATTVGKVYVRVGESEARIVRIQRASGNIDRLIAQATNLSPVVVGGIAIDDAGVTVGIVESVTGTEASIIPLAAIRQAAKRVIERQSSVPRPLLGIRGEAIGFVPRAQLLINGWPAAEATALLDKRQGIMLTDVVPGTPAALARLRPGDVILRVNEHEIKSAQDFSALIRQCEVSIPVKFTIARPNQFAPEAITVKLADAMNFAFQMEFEWPQAKAAQATTARKVARAVAGDPLAGLGIETLAFAPRAAARLRAQSGLVVVSVDPEGIGYRGGVREGDVIETIDNRTVAERRPEIGAVLKSSQTIVLGIVRNGQRTQITIKKEDEKKD
jgi:S1-C subfamily serine protease